MEAGETSLGGLEMRKMMNCCGFAVKWQSSYFHLLMFVVALVYTVQSTQEMHTRDCVLTGLGGHGCGSKTRVTSTAVGSIQVLIIDHHYQNQQLHQVVM